MVRKDRIQRAILWDGPLSQLVNAGELVQNLTVGCDLAGDLKDLLIVSTEKFDLPDIMLHRCGERTDRLIDRKDVDGVASGGEVDGLLHKAAQVGIGALDLRHIVGRHDDDIDQQRNGHADQDLQAALPGVEPRVRAAVQHDDGEDDTGQRRAAVELQHVAEIQRQDDADAAQPRVPRQRHGKGCADRRANRCANDPVLAAADGDVDGFPHGNDRGGHGKERGVQHQPIGNHHAEGGGNARLDDAQPHSPAGF